MSTVLRKWVTGCMIPCGLFALISCGSGGVENGGGPSVALGVGQAGGDSQQPGDGQLQDSFSLLGDFFSSPPAEDHSAFTGPLIGLAVCRTFRP